MDKKPTFKCDICNNIFSRRGNLNSHITSKHSDVKFECSFCSFSCNTKGSLQRHIQAKHVDSKESQTSVKCPLCTESRHSKDEIVSHYTSQHDVVIQTDTLDFQNEEEFYNWKRTIEKEQMCEYVISSSKYNYKSDSSSRMVFTCHRDGEFKSKGKHVRRTKQAGSNKINGHCPAKLKVRFHSQGTITVEYCKTHVGHTADLGRMRLSETEKKEIAQQIAMKVPFDKILETVRLSVGNKGMERKDLLSRKDLFNIKQQYNLKSEAVRDSNGGTNGSDDTSVEGNLINEEHPYAAKQDAVVKEFQHTFRDKNMEQSKSKLRQHFEAILDTIESNEDVEIINKLLQPIIPALEASKLKRALPLESRSVCSKQMKFESKQRLFSTKVPKKLTSVLKSSMK